METLYNHLKSSPDPDKALLFFYDFLINSTAKSTIFELLISFKVVDEILFGIFSQSDTLSSFLINNSEYFFWLIEDETLSNQKNRDSYYSEIKQLLNQTSNLDKKEYLLRHYRKREYLRIATREIINACLFEEIMEELSNLADALIESSVEIAYLRLKKTPKLKGFCVIGLGKLGNRELNFSSDVDLMFVHENEECGEFYNKLASRVVSILSINKEGGFVYRVDTRLRPGGFSYPLSMSLGEYENYYYTFGQPWERLSLVKARPVAGDRNLGDKFLKLIEPFSSPKNIDIEFIKEIRSLMFKIHKNFKTEDCFLPQEIQDIKKGKGGIREIEFILNYFQLIFGAKYRELKHISTTKGLLILYKLGLLNEAKKLIEVYLFYRRIEHKLQLKQEKQTQILPCTKSEIAILAKSLGESPDDFTNRYKKYTKFVHSVFKKVFVERVGLPIFSSHEDLEGYLNEYNVENSTLISKRIIETVKKYTASGIKKESIQEIFDFAFNLTRKLNLFDSVVNGLNKINPTYVNAIAGSKRLLETFIKLLALGYGERIAKNQSLLDTIVSPSKLDFDTPTYREKERIEFEIIIKLISSNYNHEDLKYPTKLAKEYIKNICMRYDLQGSLAVIGYGKLASDELFIGSDLDLVFVCKDEPIKQEKTVIKIIKELKRLYDVDLRLRPFGEKGSLVVDVAFLKNYFDKDASSWEKQAAQKSKVIYSGFGKLEIEILYKDFITNSPPKIDEIWKMFKKIEKNKAKGLDIKSSEGCLTNIEFIVQAICFRRNCIEYSENTLQLLEKIKDFEKIDTSSLREAYIFYFKVLNALRIAKKTSKLDSESAKLVEFILSEEGILNKVEIHRNKVIEINKQVFM